MARTRLKSLGRIFSLATLLVSLAGGVGFISSIPRAVRAEIIGRLSSQAAVPFPRGTPPTVGEVVARARRGPFQVAVERFLSTLPKETKERVRIGVSVRDGETGEELVSVNASEPFVPASVMKLLTSVAALRLLGAEYQFPTEFFVSRRPDVSGAVGDLYIRGYGDPSFVDETVQLTARAIVSRGVRRVERLIVDDSLFKGAPPARGADPYAAALSATPLNFNSYALTIAPQREGAPAVVTPTFARDYLRVKSAVKTVSGAGESISIHQNPPSDVPVDLPTVWDEQGKRMLRRAGSIDVDVQGTIGVERDVVTRYQTVPHPPSYFGQAMKEVLEGLGVFIRGGVFIGETAADAELLYTHRSRELAVVLRDLNQWSNNFIAGQLLFAMGQEESGFFSQERGLERIRKLFAEEILPGEKYEMIDGSGLDRRNRLAAAQLTKLLVTAYRDFSLAPDFIASLGRFRHTGTVKKRQVVCHDESGEVRTRCALRTESIWAKTGSLNGVSSLAGYAVSQDDRRVAFAIIVNGPLDKSTASEIEDGILRSLVGM